MPLREAASRMFRWSPGIGCVIVSAVCLGLSWQQCGNDDILRIAYGFPDGGQYSPLDDTGVPSDIDFKGTRILKAARGGKTYCCGYTFAVVMRAVEARGLLRKKEPWNLKRFQREWYGATPESRYRQAAFAIEQLGIGHEFAFSQARPGDFLILWRGKSGHSVILLELLRRNEDVIGVRYRSSQQGTNGIGDTFEYFRSNGDGFRASGFADATIDAVVVARLNCR